MQIPVTIIDADGSTAAGLLDVRERAAALWSCEGMIVAHLTPVELQRRGEFPTERDATTFDLELDDGERVTVRMTTDELSHVRDFAGGAASSAAVDGRAMRSRTAPLLVRGTIGLTLGLLLIIGIPMLVAAGHAINAEAPIWCASIAGAYALARGLMSLRRYDTARELMAAVPARG